MLTKAILTGGVLSVLAGSIVYFGTEGADALEVNAVDTVRVEETELAGAPDITNAERVEVEVDTNTSAAERAEVLVAEADVEDPPQETSKPKTRWLDQYLKRSKSEKLSEETAVKDMPKKDMSEPEVSEPDMSSATTYEDESVDGELRAESASDDLEKVITEENMVDSAVLEESDEKKKTIMRVEKRKKRDGAHGEAKGTYVVSKDSRSKTIDIENLKVDALDIDGNADVEAILEELGIDSEKNVEIRIVKKMNETAMRPEVEMDGDSQFDYGLVLEEANKLLVTDMRNQAYLEIIDHAIDQGDVMQAADIVDELSTPELRDTARARIGVGLAKRGSTEAAFAVLDALEIDELSAPIRLEIITALMSTQQERKAFASPG